MSQQLSRPTMNYAIVSDVDQVVWVREREGTFSQNKTLYVINSW